ncbi:MAG: proline--tRNA ligase [bacterium]
MRLSKGFVPTVKETPNDATIPSHQLMIRAGMVRSLSAGIYSWLPLGYKTMKKVCEIVRQEMDAIGAQEFHLPALNPVEIWEETGRVKAFGDTMFHLKNRPLVLAPTHEEIICWIAKNHIESYKEMPQIWYQIQMKFRNEPRPRSGVLRGRQFLMKDSYSLDTTWDALDVSYDLHAGAYKKIFTRCGLKFFIVGASSGAMGGTGSQEFMLESDSGEDTIALSDDNSYAANLEIATSSVPIGIRNAESKPIQEVHTPNVKTIDDLTVFLKVDRSLLAKSVVYWADDKPVLILMMGNDELNESKLTSVLGADVRPIEAERLKELTGADGGSIGPVGLKGFKIIADKRLEGANGLVSGANRNDFHLLNIDLQRDCTIDGYFDLRTVQAGEKAPGGNTSLRIVKGIELGHIFKLGTKYSDALKATYLDEKGESKPIIMGSYGIGIERIIACHIEQNHDANGIIWDRSIAPYDVHLIAVSMKSEAVANKAEQLYKELEESGIEVLYDDRVGTSPGFKFKDADLLGMPVQIIVGDKNLANGKLEIKIRKSGERILAEAGDVMKTVKSLLDDMK